MRWNDAAGLGEGTAVRGWPLVHRLMYVAQHAPDARHEAALQAAHVLQEQTAAIDVYRAAMALADAPVDDAWIDATHAQVVQDREKLMAELRMYQNNVIQESIRMAHQDLGDHFRHTGEFDEALVHYEKMREYCTTNEHALEMYMRATQVAWDLQQYATVLAYADKADAVLATLANVHVALPGQTEVWRAALAQGNTGTNAIRALFHTGNQTGGNVTERAPAAPTTGFQSARDAWQGPSTSHADFVARVRAFRTLALWAQADKRAPLPDVDLDATHVNAYADVVPVSQLAWYAVLSALSAPSTTQRARAEALAASAAFRTAADAEPAPRDVLVAYLASDFAKTRELLSQHAPALRLDPVMGDAAPALLEALEARLLARYLTAFRRTTLSALGTAFAREPSEIAAQLVALVTAGDLRARLNWQQQTVEVESPEDEASRSDALGTAVRQASALRARIALTQQLQQAKYVQKKD
ncbi:hypothetical protein MBRA1_002928 [Malassezia brasiliensis]|uniref:26S proteasome regulatory subunit Rpn7 N-terminal domain-containing protein n=1 Tax=Malassezia brasiliensis TaxID=1821822 RepID=A0AAF0IQP6_9BASI|nr:hypothetical protein MBRA1_002928 [Malassezia brasiliensis]